jgi:hypothetical protein
VVAGDRPERPGIVVHLVAIVRLDDRELTIAKTEVERVFRHAGVDVTWAGNPIPVPTDIDLQQGGGRPHVVLFLADAQGPTAAGVETAGEAWRSIGRAYVYRNRVVEEAKQHQTEAALILGRAMSHELGHLLLPPNSHSREGIMQPGLDYNSFAFHIFEPTQASKIRKLLTDMMSR